LRPTRSLIRTFRPPPVVSEAEPTPGGSNREAGRRWRRGLLAIILCGALALTFTVGLLAAQTTDGPWTETAMIIPRNSHTLTLLLDGRALAAGGWDGVHPLAETELYDPAAGVWRATGPLSEARVFHTASLLPDGRVLVVGGWDVLGQALTSTEVYDPQAGAWQSGPAMTFSRAGHTATTLPRGLVLVVGGYTAGGLQAAAELYDPAKDAWTPAGSLHTARAHHTATLLPDGRVLVVGGWDSENWPLASVEIYDPARNSWQPAAGLATARLDHTATLLPDGTVLVAGGYNGVYLASAEVYDPARDAWTPAGNLNVARASHTAALLQNGKVLLVGGVDGVRPSDTAETYHPQTRQWTPTGRLHKAYAAQQALVLRDGKLLITGRPDSGDLTGNDGYPTTTPTPGPRTPGPLDWLLTPLPTATPGARQGNSADTATAFRAAEQASIAAAAATIPDFSGHFDDAALYGAHEISFTLPALPAGSNPYDISNTHYITFTPQIAPSDYKKVMAFYNGPQGNRDIWTARVYVNHVGQWTWTVPDGAWDFFTGQPFTTTTFTAVERPESGLRGMLRVTSGISGSGKRWYTDDGRTFLPMADTAYRLFFEMPAAPVPGSEISSSFCPTMTLNTAANADDFVFKYATDVQQHGINVLRAESLGNWAYTDAEIAKIYGCGRTCTRLDDCNADLSLFWSTALTGSSNDLFDGGPDYTEMQSLTLYPNLQSFQRADRKLELLLNKFPALYVQLLLVPDAPNGSSEIPWPAASAAADGFDTMWTAPDGISAGLRQQLWQTMIARWAAFPNVFWSISNDTNDTMTNNRKLAGEVGCYWMGPKTTEGSYCNNLSLPFEEFGNDPWRANRPMSFGHLRNAQDYFNTISVPWHTYITNYTGADTSAQAMDGTMALPDMPSTMHEYGYASQGKPTFNTEDLYEGDALQDPNYFFRRLFWAHLLSDSGATYGSYNTYAAIKTYSTPAPAPTLVGLNSLQNIQGILHDARINLAQFQPADLLVPKSGSSEWAEFDRGQVARRGTQDILAYIPNTAPAAPPVPNLDNRKGAVAATTGKMIQVDMTAFTNTVYAVTWYDPTTGLSVVPPDGVVTVTGNITGAQQALRTLTTPPGDAVLHISSPWCPSPNVCEEMDDDPPLVITSTLGFKAGADQNTQLVTDTRRVALDYPDSASWRCDRLPATETAMPGCWVRHDFNADKTVASADFYFQRNSGSSYLGIYFITMPPSSGQPPLPVVDGEAATSIDVWMGPGGDLNLRLDSGSAGPTLETKPGALPALNRWYHLTVRASKNSTNSYTVDVSVDGVSIVHQADLAFKNGDQFFRRTVVHTAWWGPTNDLPSGSTPSVWWDDLAIDPPATTEIQGLYEKIFQQALAAYTGSTATYFDGSGGYNNTALLHVGANNSTKSLLWFNTASIPPDAVVDEAILQFYNTGRSNGNTLTLGAHGVLADWVDAEANKTQRKNGVNWNVVGMGSGSDYTAAAAATASLTGAGNAWIDLDITDLAQAWVSDPADNLGLVLTQEAASGYVVYDFCSELGWSLTPDGLPPCSPALAPKLTLRYHLAPPPPVKTTFQQGASGYSGTNATYFDGAAGYNNTSQWHVGQNNSMKALLRFDLPTLPITATVDEATLRLYQTSRSNGNSLTLRAEPQDEALGAHRVLANWIDAEANKTQRQNGVNWAVVGMGSGSDYAAEADGTADLASAGGAWIDLDVTAMAQAWAANPADNHGLVLTQEAASGSVYYNFCSELGWPPCTAAQAPRLTIWYH